MSKPKIDLKARLGKRAGPTPAGASIPPPVAVNPQYPAGGVPVPQSYPGQGYPGQGYPGQGHPAQGHPAQGHPAHPGERQSYDPMGQPIPMSAPGSMGQPMVMGQPAAPVRVAASAAFDVDDEGFAAVQRGRSRKVIVLAVIAAAVGMGIGFGLGGMSERDSVAESAVIGAKSLITEIDAASAVTNQLSDVLDAAGKALKDGKYPEEQVKALGGINVPFDGTNLANKSIGRFSSTLITQLINYSEAASRVNQQKEKLRSLLSYSKQGIEELLAQKTSPTVRWGVSVQDGPQGPYASMQVLPSAFPANEKAWPATFEFADGKGKVSLKRYTGGDPTRGGGDGNQIIPVAPLTQNAVCPTDTIVRLRRELSEMQRVLKGDNTPGQETDGIVQLGESIKKQLSAIGGKAAASAAAPAASEPAAAAGG